MSPVIHLDPPTAVRAPLFRTVFRAWVLDPLVFGLAAFPLTLIGRVRRVAELRRHRLDTTRTPTSSGTGRPGGTAMLVIATIPVTLVAFVAALLVLYLVYFAELYPLRPDVIGNLGYLFTPMPDSTAWGGPTVFGAWFVHAMTGLGMQFLALALIRGLGALCGRISRPLIGS